MEVFINSLQEGEKAVVWVNEDHYITVTKLENGNYSVEDINVNNGEKVEYGKEEIKKILSGTKYNAVGEDGKVRVLTGSKGLEQAAVEGKAEQISQQLKN